MWGKFWKVVYRRNPQVSNCTEQIFIEHLSLLGTGHSSSKHSLPSRYLQSNGEAEKSVEITLGERQLSGGFRILWKTNDDRVKGHG